MSSWILLRGLTRESRHWGNFPDILRQGCGDAEVHSIDLPGNGRLNRQPSPLQVAGMVENCRRELVHRNIAPPYFVLAMSLGAMVAVAWATRHPEELAGCVLINTSLRPFSPFYHRLKPGAYLPLLGILLRERDAVRREATILRLTSCQPERTEIQAAWADYARQNPVSRRNALRQLLAVARYEAPAAKPQPPLLILASAQDRLVDPRCSRQLAARWDTAFAEHPGAGHDLPLDDAPWVVQQVDDWLASLLSRAAPGG